VVTTPLCVGQSSIFLERATRSYLARALRCKFGDKAVIKRESAAAVLPPKGKQYPVIYRVHVPRARA
jgi:hypothetical protein